MEQYLSGLDRASGARADVVLTDQVCAGSFQCASMGPGASCFDGICIMSNCLSLGQTDTVLDSTGFPVNGACCSGLWGDPFSAAGFPTCIRPPVYPNGWPAGGPCSAGQDCATGQCQNGACTFDPARPCAGQLDGTTCPGGACHGGVCVTIGVVMAPVSPAVVVGAGAALLAGLAYLASRR